MRKPPYVIPSMADIAVSRGTNGLSVVSTFAGGGGSCTGYEMAGYGVVWANEFEPNAAATYAANHPMTVLDTRSIRDVHGSDIVEATGLVEVDVLDGSPPCQSFSMAGQRQNGWGKVIAHADGTTQRSDDLFFEYARLLGELRPRSFVAENVAGLVRGMAKGMFKEIMASLSSQGYTVRAALLDAQWLGVPQRRQRVIIIGIREDIGCVPVFPTPFPYRYSIVDACPWLVRLGYDGGLGFSRGKRVVTDHAPTIEAAGIFGDTRTGTDKYWVESRAPDTVMRTTNRFAKDADPGAPSPTVMASHAGWSDIAVHRRKLTIAEVKRFCSFPDDYALDGTYSQQWARLGNSVPPLMMRAVAERLAPLLIR